ncbi:hypothetical protein [uncultured Aquimarina sp.]|uniref:hypothetical protein n=1 Tax=uncultured Aquimarina sp. TaxID=575652 RepID=UPI00262DF8EB|nr:hypothetical protein [uncultured Aquimarina sp.]
MNSKFSYYIELAARGYVFTLITVYGSGKLLGGQFYRRGVLPEEIATIPLSEVGGFDLAWTFMGYSYSYILFIGISQLIGACLLLFQKTKLLGVFVLMPILINIIVFDAIFFDTYGALASAMLYLFLLFLVLFLNRIRVLEMIRVLLGYGTKFEGELKFSALKTVGFVFLLMLLLFGIDQFFVNLLGH